MGSLPDKRLTYARRIENSAPVTHVVVVPRLRPHTFFGAFNGSRCTLRFNPKKCSRDRLWDRTTFRSHSRERLCRKRVVAAVKRRGFLRAAICLSARLASRPDINPHEPHVACTCRRLTEKVITDNNT